MHEKRISRLDSLGLSYGTNLMFFEGREGVATIGTVIDNIVNNSVPAVEPFVQSIVVRHDDRNSTIKVGDPIVVLDDLNL